MLVEEAAKGRVEGSPVLTLDPTCGGARGALRTLWTICDSTKRRLAGHMKQWMLQLRRVDTCRTVENARVIVDLWPKVETRSVR